jgi:AbiV family abortive infection protein
VADANHPGPWSREQSDARSGDIVEDHSMDPDQNLAAAGDAEASVRLKELADGASKVLENASALYEEASILHSSGAFSRSLFLHQISMEECAKVDMIGTWAVSAQLGMDADLRKLTGAFASHKAKNYTNAYLLPATELESDAVREKRWEDANAAFRAQQAAFHQESNSAKNGSLYVDFQSGTFTAPKDRIDEAMVLKIAKANAEYLSAARSKVRMMRGWSEQPEPLRDLMKWFRDRIQQFIETEDPVQAFGTLMEEMRTRAKDTGYWEAMSVRPKGGNDQGAV